MKFLKALAAVAALALAATTAFAQYQAIPPNAVGPLNAFGVVCNPTNAVAYPGVGAAGCTLGQTAGPIFTLGAGTGSCATTSTLKGGSTAGSLVCTGTAGAGTQVVNLPTAPNGWTCFGSDVTQGTDLVTSASSTTSATLKVTTVANTDVISFACIGF